MKLFLLFTHYGMLRAVPKIWRGPTQSLDPAAVPELTLTLAGWPDFRTGRCYEIVCMNQRCHSLPIEEDAQQSGCRQNGSGNKTKAINSDEAARHDLARCCTGDAADEAGCVSKVDDDDDDGDDDDHMTTGSFHVEKAIDFPTGRRSAQRLVKSDVAVVVRRLRRLRSAGHWRHIAAGCRLRPVE